MMMPSTWTAVIHHSFERLCRSFEIRVRFADRLGSECNLRAECAEDALLLEMTEGRTRKAAAPQSGDESPHSKVKATLVLLLALFGCGQASSPMTGTPGQVLLNGFGFGDIQVNVFRDAGEHVAFGVSDSTGSFRLLTPDASRAVNLEPGQYRLTVESVGGVLVPIPAPLAQPDKTPLVREWSGSEETLRVEFDVPVK